MRRSGKKYQPYLPPIRKIVLPEKYPKWRLILLIVLLVGGLTLIITAGVKVLTKAPGWQTITADGGTIDNCSGDFSLQYLLGQTDQPVNVENNSLTEVYSQACKDAYQIFHSQESFPEVHNLHYLSKHPGETVEVDPALFNALALLNEKNTRALYLAPVNEQYRVVFSSTDDENAAAADPSRNAGIKAYVEQVMSFVTDPGHVFVELLGDNRVKLIVSQEYADFAETMEIDTYLDFGWMRNAFIADFIADRLTAAGHTNGVLSSCDGFTRNLDTDSRGFSLNLFDRVGTDIFGAAVMEYKDVKSLVTLRNYPTNDINRYQYYSWADGSVSHSYVDPVDGVAKAALNDFVIWSRSLGCAETLLRSMDVYIAEELDAAALQALPSQGVEYAVFIDRVLYASDHSVSFSQFFDKDGIIYKRGDGAIDESIS